MSNYQAIAGVSRTLRTLLLDRMEAAKPTVTIAPPDLAVTSVSGRRVNLFLYQISENGYLKNQEIPGQGNPGAYGHPPLCLELYYLMTVLDPEESEITQDSDGMAQELLGDAMRVLHDHAIVSEDLRITRAGMAGVGDPILDSSLRGEFERIKITFQPVSLEDLSKIWTALPKVSFRRSVAYQVSVVQIESRRTRRLPMPVETRRIHVTTLRRPEVTALYRTPGPGEPIGDGRIKLDQEVTIEGLGFAAPKTWVRLGGLEPIRVTPETDTRIKMAVPDSQYPIDDDHDVTRPIPPQRQLQPGPQIVEVLTEWPTEVVRGGLDNGTVVADRKALRSNQAVFMLVPEISSITPTSGQVSRLLTVTGRRLYRDRVTSFVLVSDAAIEVRKPGPTDPWAAPTTTSVEVPLTLLATAVPPPPPGGQAYPVRVLVNGAQSMEAGITFTLRP
jgi:hypothetical protein